MKLGILVNTDRHLAHIVGLARAAVAQGHEVTIFAMDRGTRLVGEVDLLSLCTLEGVDLSLCAHSAEEEGVDTKGIPKDVICGSQFNNAMMNHQADRVITL